MSGQVRRWEAAEKKAETALSKYSAQFRKLAMWQFRPIMLATQARTAEERIAPLLGPAGGRQIGRALPVLDSWYTWYSYLVNHSGRTTMFTIQGQFTKSGRLYSGAPPDACSREK